MGIGRFCWGPLGIPNSGYSCRSPRSSAPIHTERYSCQMSDADPFIVKVDIEGFEADLFSANTQWVGRTPIIITELHNWLIRERR